MKRNKTISCILHAIFVIISVLFICIPTCAKNDDVKCGGTYPYTYSENLSHAEAKALAVEYAIRTAMADRFGTTVTSQSLLQLTDQGDSFEQLSLLQVQGTVVRHVHEPQISAPVFADNMFTINVTVEFYARPLNSAPVEFEAKVLCNGKEDRFESNRFVADDKFYMSFQSPKSGYMAIYYEGNGSSVCILPYVGDDETPFYVEKGKRYLLFDVTNNTYHLDCGIEPEINKVHVIFSPKSFIKDDVIREMSSKKFQEWLGKRRSYDEEMQVQTIMIRVSPKQQ